MKGIRWGQSQLVTCLQHVSESVPVSINPALRFPPLLDSLGHAHRVISDFATTVWITIIESYPI
jgi:hypothetical protein